MRMGVAWGQLASWFVLQTYPNAFAIGAVDLSNANTWHADVLVSESLLTKPNILQGRRGKDLGKRRAPYSASIAKVYCRMDGRARLWSVGS